VIRRGGAPGEASAAHFEAGPRAGEGDASETLLYVAFTRARDRLVLAGAMKKEAPAVAALEPLCDGAAQPVLELPFGEDEGEGMARARSAARSSRWTSRGRCGSGRRGRRRDARGGPRKRT